MDKGYEKEGFEGLKIKASVAQRFRMFCKRLSKSQSMTLMAMMDFFEINELSPDERLGPSHRTLERKLNKRFNAIIAIIESIEKSQTKPTQAMLEALFTQTETEEAKPVIMKRDDELDDARFEDWDGKDF